jgi:hypothetical protein
MTAIANVELINTFDTWRIRTNRGFTRLNALAVSDSTLFANTVNANVAFRSAGTSVFVGNVVFGNSIDANGNPILLDATANTRIQGTGTNTIKIQAGIYEPIHIVGANVSINETKNPRTDGQNATLNVFQSGDTNTVIVTSNAYSATLGPELALFRDNNVRAAADNIGVISFRGRSNANNARNYARIYTTIDDHSNNLEDGAVTTQVMKAGALTDMFEVNNDGVQLHQGFFTFGANTRVLTTQANTLTICSDHGSVPSKVHFTANGVGIGTQSIGDIDTKLVIDSGHLRLTDAYTLQWGGTDVKIAGSDSADTIEFKTNNATKVMVGKDQVAYSANVVPSADNTYSLGASGNEWAVGHFETVNGTLGTAAQPNITSIGTLTSLTVSGQMTFSGSVVFSQNSTTTSGTVTLDFDSYQNHFLTLNGNITLANPTTENVGQAGVITLKQDGTGSRTLSIGTDWETVQGAGYTLSTAAGATDIIPYYVVGTDRVLLGMIQKALA